MAQASEGAAVMHASASNDCKPQHAAVCHKHRISILIFPKAFEERNFLACCHTSRYLVRKCVLAKTEAFLIYWPIGKKCAKVFSVHITQSDIQFTLRLVNFISALRQEFDQKDFILDLILCGSCGGNKEEGKSITRIGDVVEIDDAIKFDRGEMWLTADIIPKTSNGGDHAAMEKKDAEGGKWLGVTITQKNGHPGAHLKRPLEEQKPYMMAPKQDEPYLVAKSAAKFHSHKATAICSNYIMNIPPVRLVEALGLKIAEGSKTVVDMETFDFFSVCTAFEIRHYRAMRVMSDVESTTDNPRTYDPTKKRAIRKNVPMDNLLLRLFHHLSWFHLENLHELPDEETKVILKLHSASELNLPQIDLTQMICDLYGEECVPLRESPGSRTEEPVHKLLRESTD